MWLPPLNAAPDEPDVTALQQTYQPNIHPLLKTYCHECHSGEDAEAEIDLAALKTMAAVRRFILPTIRGTERGCSRRR